MVKGGKKSNTGYVYGVMEELQRLRDSVAALTENNRDLAKQLNVTKMELARERKQVQAIQAEQVMSWATRSAHGNSTTCDASVQCGGGSGEVETTTEHYVTGRGTPPQRRGTSSNDPRRSLSPKIKIVRRELLIMGISTRESSEQANAVDEDVQMRTPSPTKSSDEVISPDLSAEAEDTVARTLGPQFEMHRRLRHRKHDISYIEIPLNRKIRRGDHYGFAKRPRAMTPRSQSLGKQMRHQSSDHESALLSLATQAALAIPIPTTTATTVAAGNSPIRRTTRPRKVVSYALPKLNTKLRQGDQFTFTT